MSPYARLAILAAVGAIMAPGAALAYVGPGAGLGMIGSLIAVAGAVLIAILGLVILPFRMLMKRRKDKLPDAQKASAPAGNAQQS